MNQNFCTVLLKKSCINLCKLFHTSGIHSRNHYETLKLKRNCTTQEIRDSFIKLSKENHPDVNRDPKAHEKFLQIQESYNILSKKESRINYDLGLSTPHYVNKSNSANVRSQRHNYESYEGQARNPWDEPFFYHHRARAQDGNYEPPPYYGIKGLDRVSNGTVALYIIVLAISAFIGQMIVINYSVSMQREKTLRKSQEIQQMLNELKARADENGKERQIEILRKRFEAQGLIERDK